MQDVFPNGYWGVSKNKSAAKHQSVAHTPWRLYSGFYQIFTELDSWVRNILLSEYFSTKGKKNSLSVAFPEPKKIRSEHWRLVGEQDIEGKGFRSFLLHCWKTNNLIYRSWLDFTIKRPCYVIPFWQLYYWKASDCDTKATVWTLWNVCTIWVSK